eukprot:COSAG06_NODE_9562_length_1870_cov_1.624506_3_plen_165_part_00
MRFDILIPMHWTEGGGVTLCKIDNYSGRCRSGTFPRGKYCLCDLGAAGARYVCICASVSVGSPLCARVSAVRWDGCHPRDAARPQQRCSRCVVRRCSVGRVSRATPVAAATASSAATRDGCRHLQPYRCKKGISHNFTRSNITPEQYLTSPRPPMTTLVRARPP